MSPTRRQYVGNVLAKNSPIDIMLDQTRATWLSLSPKLFLRERLKTLRDHDQWSDAVVSHLTAAELFGEDKTVIPLTPSADDPTKLEGLLTALKSQKYRLHLVDEAERANKNPPWFTVTVQSNWGF
jgi:hypothetical protein